MTKFHYRICCLFSAVDVNDTFDDDEADPEYNVLADEEEQTGINLIIILYVLLYFPL